MPLINCKVELKPKWTKYCVLATNDSDNDDAHSNNIIFTITSTKAQHVPVVTLSANTTRNYQKTFAR